MPNNNLWPGQKQRFESAVTTDIDDIEDIAPPGVGVPRPTPRPPVSSGRGKISISEAPPPKKMRNGPPQMPLRWMFEPTGRRTRAAPARRIFLVGCGLVLLIFSAYLSALALQNHIPAFRNKTPGLLPTIQGVKQATQDMVNIGAWLSGIVVTLIFAGIELAIFRLMGFSYASVAIVGFVYAIDLWINIDGVTYLWGITGNWIGLNLTCALVIVVGAGAAVLPELFIKIGWGD